MWGFLVKLDKIDPAKAGAKLFEWIMSIFSFFIIERPVLIALKAYLILSKNLGGRPPWYIKSGATKIILMFLLDGYFSS